MTRGERAILDAIKVRNGVTLAVAILNNPEATQALIADAKLEGTTFARALSIIMSEAPGA